MQPVNFHVALAISPTHKIYTVLPDSDCILIVTQLPENFCYNFCCVSKDLQHSTTVCGETHSELVEDLRPFSIDSKTPVWYPLETVADLLQHVAKKHRQEQAIEQIAQISQEAGLYD